MIRIIMVCVMAIAGYVVAQDQIKFHDYWGFNSPDDVGTLKKDVQVSGMPFAIAQEITIVKKPDYAWRSQLVRNMAPDTILRNDSMTVQFYMRAMDDRGAKTTFAFEERDNTFLKSVSKFVEAGKEWQKFEIGFRAKIPDRLTMYKNFDAGMRFWVGYDPQHIQIGGVKLFYHGQAGYTVDPVSVIHRENFSMTIHDAASGNKLSSTALFFTPDGKMIKGVSAFSTGIMYNKNGTVMRLNVPEVR